MYSSSSSPSFDPFQYNSTFSTDNPNPNSLSFLPFLHDNGGFLLSESFFQQDQHQLILNTSKSAGQEDKEMDLAALKKAKKKSKANDSKQQPNPRKRTGKKDRHSKIYTAQGPRDRRMRLSLQIARKFFDLQDMLGFDKASKTIDWLFSKSRSAIKEVTDNFAKLKRSESPESEVLAEKTSDRPGKKAVLISVVKKSRAKARERAKERTKEKLKNKIGFEKSKGANPSKEMNLSPEAKNAGFEGIIAATRSASIFDLSNPINGADFEVQFSGFPGNCGIKLGNVHVENPNSIFMMASPNYPNLVYQDQNLTSLAMASLQPDEQNPNFLFMNFSNSTHQIATPLFPMSTHYNENCFSCNPNVPIRFNGSLF